MENIERRVKLFTAILFNSESLLNEGCKLLEEHFGEIDFRGRAHNFDKTNYYEREMGTDLKRCFISFEKLILPEQLPQIRLTTGEIERELSQNELRRLNIDPGYIDYMKVILASCKYGPHKIYLDHGVYADLTLIYSKGKYNTFPWSFPDFQNLEYHKELIKIREKFKQSNRRATCQK